MDQAIQDLIPHNHCWGCGTLNPRGLRIKSYPDGEETVLPLPALRGPHGRPHRRRERRDHRGGHRLPLGVHGHRRRVPRRGARAAASEPLLWAVTASLKIDYLAPTPMGAPMELRARVREAKGRKRIVDCTLRAGGRDCARAEVIAVEVGAAWHR